MTPVIQVLREFPAIFAILGIGVGGMVMFLVHKKYGPMQTEAFNKVFEAQSKLSQIQGEQHMQTLQMQKDHWAEELAKLEKERDTYRGNLHAEKEAHNACQLKIQELLLRPTVEVLQTEQQTFYAKMLELLADISKAIKAHDDGIPARILDFQRPILEACSQISDGMNALVASLQNCGALPEKRKGGKPKGRQTKTTSFSQEIA